MARDIDYAAVAVHKALVEKFGRKADLQALEVKAGETTISIEDGPYSVQGTRDNLLAAVRAADSYEAFWQQFPNSRRSSE